MEVAHASFGALSGGDVAAQRLALTPRGRAEGLHERLNYRVSCSVAILLPALFNAFPFDGNSGAETREDRRRGE